MAFDWYLVGWISRFAVAFISIWLFVFFWKRYEASKSGPSPNMYFAGNALFFLTIGIVLILVGFQELMDYFKLWSVELDHAEFPWDDGGDHNLYFANTLGVNPIYVALSIVVVIVFAVQIMPLEIMLGKKKWLSKLLFTEAGLLGTVYIPLLTFTLYHFAVTVLAILCILLAFFMNFGLTASLIKNSTGIVRTRAIKNIGGFFLFLVGLVWGMRVGWTEGILAMFGMDGSLQMDVVVGNLVILCAIYVYWSGFTSNKQD